MASSDTGFFSIFFYLFCDILRLLDIVETERKRRDGEGHERNAGGVV